MIIRDDKKIWEIQNEFNAKFPFLKIEFYQGSHEAMEGSPVQEQIDNELTIDDARKIHKEGDISIDGHLKVSTLEQMFMETYGLNAQVFRRSGDIWLQTTSTDAWTLAKQNRNGAASVAA